VDLLRYEHTKRDDEELLAFQSRYYALFAIVVDLDQLDASRDLASAAHAR